MLVELEADPVEDPDFDADQGALLVIPTAIESVRPIEPEAVQTIRSLTERMKDLRGSATAAVQRHAGAVHCRAWRRSTVIPAGIRM